MAEHKLYHKYSTLHYATQFDGTLPWTLYVHVKG